MRSSTPTSRSSPHLFHQTSHNTSSFSSSSASSLSLLPTLSSTQVQPADTHTNAATRAPASSSSSSSSSSSTTSLAPPSVTSPSVTAPSTSAVAPSSPPQSPSSTPHATQVHATPTMSDAAIESRHDDPSALDTKPQETLIPAPSIADHVNSQLDSTSSHPLSVTDPSALPSASTSPGGAQTPQPTSTITTLQLASDALSTIPIPQSSSNPASVPTAAAQILSAIHRRNKKAPAVQSPHPAIIRSRSLATTPVPSSLLLGVKHDSLHVTANSSRATTPTRTPPGRAKRQRRERNAATPTASVSALPSLDQNDRRRSARVAKAVTATASDSPSLPNLALFGFSPYLENLVLNAKDSDRRTRSGGRGIRPPIDRGPTKLKRTAVAKSKPKETDPDGPDDDAKLELYRQLCIISYQLQAHLDMVPHKSLAQLRVQFSSPSPEHQHDLDAKLAPQDTINDVPGASRDPSRPSTPTIVSDKHVLQLAPPNASDSTYTQPIVVKAEPPQSPPLSARELPPSRPPYSPESSPEVALMDTVRPSYNNSSNIPPYYPNASQSFYQTNDVQQPDPYSWSAAKVNEPEDEPMSPVFRPRGNIMSISALMSGPSPSKARSPTPELIQTPPRPVELLPAFMQEWTQEDEMASQFLQACADAIPKVDTTELDRLTQIAQLAAFDLEILSVPTSPHVASSPQTPSTPVTEQQQRDAGAKFDPKQLDPLKTLDTQQLYDREEAEYLEEMQANDELYENVRCLSSFDEVVDEWRAGELARLRLQLEMRKAEVDRIWTCDRKLAWSTFIDNRAGELYRKAMMKASHSRWQAEMELDLVGVHRRKTRGLAKLTSGIWLPDGEGLEGAETAKLYERYGKFVSAAKYPELDDPLVRADVRKMRNAVRAHKRDLRKVLKEVSQEQADASEDDAARQTEADVAMAEAQADAVSSYESDSEGENHDSQDEQDYDSDSSYASSSSGVSSLPSFSSVYSSPRVQAVVPDAEVVVSDLDGPASEAASVRGADAEEDSDEDADESLWARQMRLANQMAEHKDAVEAVASGVQTPVVAAVADGDVVSALPSRAASPVGSIKAQARKQRESKRRKRPPPPGARLWKKGRVQKDAEGAEDEQVDELPQSQSQSQQQQQQLDHDHATHSSHYPNGDAHHRDTEMAEVEVAHSVSGPKMQALQGGEVLEFRRDPQQAMPHQPYGGYGMRPSYLGRGGDEYDYGRPMHQPAAHLDAYSSGGRGYPSYADRPYAHPAGYPAYAQDGGVVRGGYSNGGPPQQRYARTPPLPEHVPYAHHAAVPYGQYERAAPPLPQQRAYPSHPPPLPQHHQQQAQQAQQREAGRPQWPY